MSAATNNSRPSEGTGKDPAPERNEEVEGTGMDPVLQDRVHYGFHHPDGLHVLSSSIHPWCRVAVQREALWGKRTEGTTTNVHKKLNNAPINVLNKIDVPVTAEGTTYAQWCRYPCLRFQAAPSSYKDCCEAWLLRNARRIAIHQWGCRASHHLPVGYVHWVEAVHLKDRHFYSLTSNWFPDRTRMNGASKGCKTNM